MSEYESTDDTEDSDVSVIDSFAFLSKVKSNTPRARFDIHFYPDFIQLLQYSVQKQVSNRYRILKENVSEMLRLPYSNGKQIFFVLHLKRPIVGGNKSFTKYDFVVFNFAEEDYEEVNLDLSNPIVEEMFSEDIEDGCIVGQTFEVFEKLLVKIFAKDVTTPAKNYEGSTSAPGLQCTFWDSDDHFLYPLDNGFVNVWKYCQKLNFKEVKSVRFVRSQGRFKTFDFYIYPKLERSIRRYNIGSSKSQYVNCFILEFKAIDQQQYNSLQEYCDKNQIAISTDDFRESASASSDSDGDESASTEADTNSSGSDVEFVDDDDYEAPDPHLARCQTEGRYNESGTSSEENEPSDASQESNDHNDKSSTSRPRRKVRLKNTVSDEDDRSSHATSNESESQETVSPQKRSIRIESDDNGQPDNGQKIGRKRTLIINDSDEDGGSRSPSHNSVATDLKTENQEAVSRKRSFRIESDDESKHGSGHKRKRTVTINDSDEDGDSLATGVRSENQETVSVSPRKRSFRISDDESQHVSGNKVVRKRTITIHDSDDDD